MSPCQYKEISLGKSYSGSQLIGKRLIEALQQSPAKLNRINKKILSMLCVFWNMEKVEEKKRLQKAFLPRKKKKLQN